MKMAMKLESNDGEVAVFSSDSADAGIPNEEIRRSATSLNSETFRRIGPKGRTKAEFEAKIEEEEFPEIAGEFKETIGPRDPNSGIGFGLGQAQPGSRYAAQVKDQMAEEDKQKKK
jgi:hypothetical protein